MAKLSLSKEENASFRFSVFDNFSITKMSKFLVLLELNTDVPQQINVVVSSANSSVLNHQRNSQNLFVFCARCKNTSKSSFFT